MRRSRFARSCSKGLAPDGGLAVPTGYPRLSRGRARATARPVVSGARVRGAVALHRRHSRRASSARSSTARTRPRSSAARTSRRSPRSSRACHLLRACERADARVQGHRAAAPRQPVRVRAARRRTARSTSSARRRATPAARPSTRCAASGASRVFMLSPHGRMSAFQQAQMYALDDPNIHNLAIDGTFDDCQDIVKAVTGDAAFKRRHALGAVNSINWARVAAQVVYYFKGYFAATTARRRRSSFAVPSGNFGNMLAGHVAREMGLPIAPAHPRDQRERRARRVLPHRPLSAARRDARRRRRRRRRWTSPRRRTSSASCSTSSAAILRAVRALWQRLARDGQFDLAATPMWPRVAACGFVSGKSTHADRVATIRDVDVGYGTLIDPHTADGVKVGRELREAGVPLVCLETALPAKFAATIREALGREPPRPPAYADLESRPQRCTVLPADAARVRRTSSRMPLRRSAPDSRPMRNALNGLGRNLAAVCGSRSSCAWIAARSASPWRSSCWS